jgi:N-formylglutamate amidohydrolase
MNAPLDWPGWVIFHVPHDSTWIPDNLRDQFLLDDIALNEELLRMTDHFTRELFTAGVPGHQVVRSPVSRLVVDVERFEDDDQEPMSRLGMGMIYTHKSDLRFLRRSLHQHERESLIQAWYRPHHDRLTRVTEAALRKYRRALLIDCHSFPSRPLPYEPDQRQDRPQICIGTDPFHTPADLITSLLNSFESAGLITQLDAPFSGALAPARYYCTEKRVVSIMIEVNRSLYMNEGTGKRGDRFKTISRLASGCIRDGISFWLALRDNNCIGSFSEPHG